MSGECRFSYRLATNEKKFELILRQRVITELSASQEMNSARSKLSHKLRIIVNPTTHLLGFCSLDVLRRLNEGRKGTKAGCYNF